MSRLRIHAFSISLDGYAAGPDQNLDNPLGRGGEALHEWFVPTHTFQRRGWWGENPPYHGPVFVLTNHARPSLEMEGGTVFHFVTNGIEAALSNAREAADGRDVRLGGGSATIRQYLNARLVDEMHIAIAPILLGSGEALFADMDLPRLGYEVTEYVPSEKASHIVLSRRT
ncbi:dihydrofolate reductase family protein [Sinorhizobium medicae]|uniref:dihydrofolate reductase family protein n=1 Tax=Sinorhizobium medicae TaxID=110321 RepID=UPI001296555C|nr:dihydrofolate reductase family protein [Sinorhizobium medicae]MQX48800.1 dihydrofolate reductase [Sinorhizobium medicae]